MQFTKICAHQFTGIWWNYLTPKKACLKTGGNLPTELSPPIGAFLEFLSNANLPCSINLALNVKMCSMQHSILH